MSATADGTARFITRTSWLFIVVGAYVSLTVPVDILIHAFQAYVATSPPRRPANRRWPGCGKICLMPSSRFPACAVC